MIQLAATRLRQIPASLLASLVPAAVAAVAYFFTLAPGVVGFDSAELVTGSYTLGIVHPTGYPLYLLLGKLFTLLPVGSVAYRVNLLSTVLAVLSVLVLGRIIFKLTGSVFASWIGSLFLAFAHTFWVMAIVAEVYTLHTLLLGVVLLLLLRWRESPSARRLFAVALAFGFSLTNHVSSVFMLPIIVWFVWRNIGWRESIRMVPGAALACLLGLSPYLYFPIRFAADPPLNYVRTYYDVDLGTMQGMWWMVSGQAYRFFAFGYGWVQYLQELKNALSLFVQNFTLIGFLLGLGGALFALLKQRRLAIVILALLGINVLFFAGYAVIDKETMFLPGLYLWSLLIGLGSHMMLELKRDLSWLTIAERRLANAVLVAGLFSVVGLSGAVHWGWTDKSDAYGPEIFARRVLSTVPPNSMVIGKWSTAVILEYYQYVEGYRPDLLIFNRSRYEVAAYYRFWKESLPYDEALSQILKSEEGLLRILGRDRTMFDAEYDPYFARTFEYRPVGNLFKMVLRTEGGEVDGEG